MGVSIIDILSDIHRSVRLLPTLAAFCPDWKQAPINPQVLPTGWFLNLVPLWICKTPVWFTAQCPHTVHGFNHSANFSGNFWIKYDATSENSRVDDTAGAPAFRGFRAGVEPEQTILWCEGHGGCQDLLVSLSLNVTPATLQVWWLSSTGCLSVIFVHTYISQHLKCLRNKAGSGENVKADFHCQWTMTPV